MPITIEAIRQTMSIAIATFQLGGIAESLDWRGMEEEKVFPGRRSSPTLGQVAPGVWLLRGDIKGGMNIYFIEEDGGLVQFDAGTKPMVEAVKAVQENLGPIKRVVLGHSHTDHRGTAPSSDAPVYCHPDEVTYAVRDAWPDYVEIEVLPVTWVRLIFPTLHRRWDDGGKLEGLQVPDFPSYRQRIARLLSA